MQVHQLKISGMMCDACQNHVTTALKKVAGVESATVDLGSQNAIVRGDNLDVQSLTTAVEDEGYQAQILDK